MLDENPGDAESAVNSSLKQLLSGTTNDTTSSFELPDLACETSDDFVPIVKHTACYIVCSLLFDSNYRVLLIQEAKPSCRGQWYLPAGRVEPNETLVAAAQRETLEESGLMFHPDTLISLETQGTGWYRFCFVGYASGGGLKTESEADGESLQAAFFAVTAVYDGRVDIRGDDIKPLIKLGFEYAISSSHLFAPATLPVAVSHKRVYLRYLLLYIENTEEVTRMSVLMTTTPQDSRPHLPVVERGLTDKSLHRPVHRLLMEVYGGNKHAVEAKCLGMAGVEYNGGAQGDGLCLTLVYSIIVNNATSLPSSPFCCIKVTDSIVLQTVQSRLEKNRNYTMRPNFFVPILIK